MTRDPERSSKTSRHVALAAIVATFALHATIAWLSPIQGDAWAQWMWADEHAHDGTAQWLGELVRSHFTFSDLLVLVFARSTPATAVIAPAAGIALAIGMFVIAMRRLPRLASRDDVLAVVVIAALVWIATPRCGLLWFYRPQAATWLCGAALALWFLAPYRCGWRPRGAWLPLLFVAGYCTGSCTRQIGVLALVAVIIAIRRAHERPRWMWIGLAGVAIGAVVGFFDAPYVDFRGYKAAFEASLVAVELALREGGELVALMLGLTLVRLVLVKLRPAWASPDDAGPELGETLPWLWVWFGMTLLALCGPAYTEATRFPATIAIVIGAVPIVMWLVAVRPLRLLVIAIVVGIHVIVWASALRVYVPLAEAYRERIATIERTPAGGVAVIEPYREIHPTFWQFGEDFGEASSRQLIGIRLFGVRDIDFTRRFTLYEANARLAIRFEVEGVTSDQLAASHALPAYWGTEVATARGQLQRVVKALHRTVDAPFTARLVVDNLALPADIARGRPMLAAIYDGGEPEVLRVGRGRFDLQNALTITLRPTRFVADRTETYLLVGGKATPLASESGRYKLTPMTTELHAVVACNPRDCFVIDAFHPRW